MYSEASVRRDSCAHLCPLCVRSSTLRSNCACTSGPTGREDHLISPTSIRSSLSTQRCPVQYCDGFDPVPPSGTRPDRQGASTLRGNEYMPDAPLPRTSCPCKC